MSKNQVSSGGIGFGGLLTVAFVVLKLTGVITWPWILVVSPLWIGIVLGLSMIIIGVILVAIGNAIESKHLH